MGLIHHARTHTRTLDAHALPTPTPTPSSFIKHPQCARPFMCAQVPPSAGAPFAPKPPPCHAPHTTQYNTHITRTHTHAHTRNATQTADCYAATTQPTPLPILRVFVGALVHARRRLYPIKNRDAFALCPASPFEFNPHISFPIINNNSTTHSTLVLGGWADRSLFLHHAFSPFSLPPSQRAPALALSPDSARACVRTRRTLHLAGWAPFLYPAAFLSSCPTTLGS